jgi:2-amino-4-hydroxy-6-hydroxymethyldihydropteridine diphosphokinase
MTHAAAGKLQRACIALGSNLGDRSAQLKRAVALLREHPLITVDAVSSFHETDPVGGPAGQSMYLNAAALLRTPLSPQDLLEVLLGAEKSLGRDRSTAERNGPRTIDLDLLLYEDVLVDEPGLTLPHPRMHERAFVLRPLVEVAPDFIHPKLNKSVSELLAVLDA